MGKRTTPAGPTLWDLPPDLPEQASQESEPETKTEETQAAAPAMWPSMLFYADREGAVFKKAQASYSADRLGEQSRIKAPFALGARLWFSTGDGHIDWERPPGARAPRMARRVLSGDRAGVGVARWAGSRELRQSRSSTTTSWQDSGQPRGNFAGLVVTWKGKRYVCTGLRLQVALCIAVAVGAPRASLA
jgi:hypothetical protein